MRYWGAFSQIHSHATGQKAKMMLALAIVVGAVLLISATCSLFEAVLYSIRPSQVETLVKEGKPSARVLKSLRAEVDRPIAAILSLNTVANTGGGALAGALAETALGPSWIGYFAAAFTFAILMFSEIVPKTVGVVYARSLGGPIARPLQAIVVLFAPLTWLTRRATQLILKVDHHQGVSDEDVLALVGLGLSTGTFTTHEARIIENVLSLETKVARDVMTPRPVVFALPATETVEQASRRPELVKYSRVPVFGKDTDDLVGVVRRDVILMTAALGQRDVPIEQIMRPIHFLVDSYSLDKLMRWFLERRQHMVAIIDEYGGVAGIVTLEDVVEELIGREIVDESDQDPDLRAVAQQRRAQLLARNRSTRPPASDEAN